MMGTKTFVIRAWCCASCQHQARITKVLVPIIRVSTSRLDSEIHLCVFLSKRYRQTHAAFGKFCIWRRRSLPILLCLPTLFSFTFGAVPSTCLVDTRCVLTIFLRTLRGLSLKNPSYFRHGLTSDQCVTIIILVFRSS